MPTYMSNVDMNINYLTEQRKDLYLQEVTQGYYFNDVIWYWILQHKQEDNTKMYQKET
jgi:hypothetical protein